MAHRESCSVSRLGRECEKETGRWLAGQVDPRAAQTGNIDDGSSESL